MTDERFDISRRKALAALGTIGVASAGAGLGTSAYFSDQETFENNQLVAGTLDLKVAASHHYVDWLPDTSTGGNVNMPPPQETDDAEMPDGSTPDIRLNPATGDTESDPIELVLVDDVEDNGDSEDASNDENALDFALGSLVNTVNGGVPPGSFGGSLCSVRPDADGDVGRPVIDLDDVKPGDFGFVRFAFASCTNPAFVWYTGEITSKSEGGTTEPERDDPDEQSGVVELLDEVQLAVLDADIYSLLSGLGSGQTVEATPQGTLRDLEGGLEDPIAGNLPAEDGGGASDARNCFDGGTNYRRTLVWWLPLDHGNEIQSDTVEFELGLYAEQCRHNDGSGMNTDSVDDDSGTGGSGPAFDVYTGGAGDELVAEFTVQSEDDGESLTGISLEHFGGTDISNTGSGDVVVELGSSDITGDVSDISGADNGTTLDITLNGNNNLSAGDTVTVTYGDVQNRGSTTDVTGTINGDDPSTDTQPLVNE